MHIRVLGGMAAPLFVAALASAQEPAAWGQGAELTFHTFSIVAVDPRTGETGVIVTPGIRDQGSGDSEISAPPTVRGFVDGRVIERLWARLKEQGKDDEIRRMLLAIQRIR